MCTTTILCSKLSEDFINWTCELNGGQVILEINQGGNPQQGRAETLHLAGGMAGLPWDMRLMMKPWGGGEGGRLGKAGASELSGWAPSCTLSKLL